MWTMKKRGIFFFLIVKGKFLSSGLFRLKSAHIKDVWMCHFVDHSPLSEYV